MGILDEDGFYKEFPKTNKETSYEKNWKKMNKVIYYQYHKETYVMFPNEFIVKRENKFNEPQFIFTEIKKLIHQVALENGMFFR